MNKKLLIAIVSCTMIASMEASAKGAEKASAKAIKGKSTSNVVESKQVTTQEVAALKIATVDMAEVYQNYTKSKDSQESFNSLVENAQKELRAMMDEGKKMVDALQELSTKLNNPALTEEAKKKLQTEIEAKQEEIRKKEADLNQFQQDTDRNLEQKRQLLFGQNLEALQVVINEIAKKKGYTLVLNERGPYVLFTDPSFSITSLVLQAANEKAAEEAKITQTNKPAETKEVKAAEEKAEAGKTKKVDEVKK
ncbi:MAG: hypothetical protein A2007_00885 [Verrucomicrobia bacterium GWC2_42_7]|nr:MAG: hypothetical protein A2007_00885 [Verrucomicrobia bacterium GWC2_42_7]